MRFTRIVSPTGRLLSSGVLLILVLIAGIEPAEASVGTSTSAIDSAAQTRAARQALSPAAANRPAALAPPISSTDYLPAAWIPASSNNYTVADRAQDYPVDLIVIHDIEGSYASGIKIFQDPMRKASAHYVVSYKGQTTQMVRETDIAWHAGNWSYNTRAIGIEHEGYAWTPSLYTHAEYLASAHIAASICSRWGVPLDRQHVIGHNEVPDPNNPALFGGSDHHTDPGPYWNWSFYMAVAQSYAGALPSPPRMMVDPVAVNGLTAVTVTWQPAHTCRASAAPITGYKVVAQPGNIVHNLGANATSDSYTGLQIGVRYTFSVTATNSYGQDTLTSNGVVPGSCVTANLSASPPSPQTAGAQVQFTAMSAGCLNPLYQFWLRDLNNAWTLVQPFGGDTWTWDTLRYPAGTYMVSVWANRTGGGTSTWETFGQLTYTLLKAPPCTSATVTPAKLSVAVGSTVSLTAASTGCASPEYEFWVLYPNGTWNLKRGFGGPTISWSTAGLATGAYTVHAWANQQGTSWDAIGSAAVTLTNNCTTASLSPPTASQPAGSAVSLTASSSGCLIPRYEFWVQYSNGVWFLKQGFGGSAFTWDTTGLVPGRYLVHAWVNSTGSGHDAIGSATVTLSGCTTATATAPTASGPVGTNVTFTAGSSGCPNPVYEFWLKDPGGTWHLMQGFGTGDSWLWLTAGSAKGVYTIHVWANQQGAGTSPYEKIGSATYTLT